MGAFIEEKQKNDGSNLQLVCEYPGLLGGNIWHHIQRDQRLCFCHHLADLDHYSDWHYRHAT